MFDEYVKLAKSIAKGEELKRIADEIRELAERAKRGLEEGKAEALDLERDIRAKLSELIKKGISEEALELAKLFASIGEEILKDVAKRAFSKEFKRYDEILKELEKSGVLNVRTLTIRFNKIAKVIIDEMVEKRHHKSALSYCDGIKDELERGACVAYHYLMLNDFERAFEEFMRVARKVYGRHPCVETLIEVGERLAKLCKDEEERCKIMGTVGNLYLIMKKYDEAEANYKAILRYYYERMEKDRSYAKYVAGVLNNLGNLYFSKGDMKKAEECYTECLKIRMEENDEDGMVDVLLSLAEMYMAVENYENAEKCYHDALRIEMKRSKEDRDRLKNVASILNNLGFLYSRKGDAEKAERFYKEAIRIYGELSKEMPEMLRKLTTVLSNLSSLYMSSKNVEKAMEILDSLKDRWTSIPPDVRATFYFNLAKGLESKGDPRAAEFYLKAASLGFMIFRNYGVNAVNFMHCFDKAEQLGGEELKGDVKLMRFAIMKMYYGVRSKEIPEVKHGRRGEIIVKAFRGEPPSDFEVRDEVDMAAYILANELASYKEEPAPVSFDRAEG